MIRLRNGYGKHKRNINITEIDGHMVAIISLGKRKTTTISLCDIDILLEHGFYAKVRADGQCVAKSNQGKGMYLHRIIMNPDNDQQVDHVDADPLNNTRYNLRRCTSRQNLLARKPELVEGCAGIYKTKWGWYKAYDESGRKFGRYDTPEKAARARDEVMLSEYFSSEQGEELHTYSFIHWNFEAPEQAAESENYLFDEVQEAQWLSSQVIQRWQRL